MKRRFTLLALALALTLTTACASAPWTENTASAPADRAPAASRAPTAPGSAYFRPETDGTLSYAPAENGEEYLTAPESPFLDTITAPLSTFSADVDTASYANLRRFITQGVWPQGVRVEELVNYFDYDYPAPEYGGEHPFSISAEVGICPWAPGHLLAMIGIQGAQLQNTVSIQNNIVFLIDVSGSMADSSKLPLLQDSMLMLLDQLGRGDVVSIVTYAGRDTVVADSIPGNERRELERLINGLSAGGSTAGAQGLRSAYDLAAKNYIEGGNNRIILATDGDFNVGMSSVDDLTRLVEDERERGISISVLGYGMGNLQDDTMKTIAANGNGNYAYIDTLQEARKVLVDEFDATMFTIAKDVKLQVEFNPETVGAYRLIGYDTRRLENEDFNNDLKDAGDIGSGHSVTAFYELIPAVSGAAGEDGLKYSRQVSTGSADYMTVKVRYKAPDGVDSKLVKHAVGPQALEERESENFMFASAVAEFGLIVTGSQYREDSSLSSVLRRAGGGQGEDSFGLRAEFLELVRDFRRITD